MFFRGGVAAHGECGRKDLLYPCGAVAYSSTYYTHGVQHDYPPA